jgi:hypothetical protein
MLPFAFLLLAADSQVIAQRGDQWRAFEQRREGRILPLREIEGMRGAEYIGFDFDGSDGVYTLKFLRDGRVIWVEVDGRSGQVLGRTGR